MKNSMPVSAGRRAMSIAAGLALCLVLSAPSLVWAVTKISDVRVAKDAEGETAGETYFASQGDEMVHVLFDYEGASRNTRIAVQVIASSIEVFREERRFDGDGTAEFEISGDAIYSTLTDSLADKAAVIRAANNQIQRATVSAGQLDNDLNTMIGSVNQATIMVPLLEVIESQSVAEELGQLDKSLGRLSGVLEDTRNVPFDDVAERQSVLSNATTDIDELEEYAANVADAVGDLSDLTLPMMGPQWSYDVSVRVSEGSQQDIGAGDAFFYVVEGSETRTGSGNDGSDAGAAPTATRRALIGEGSTARSTRTPVPTESAAAGGDESGGSGSGDGDSEAAAEDQDEEAAAPLTLSERATATAAARSGDAGAESESTASEKDEDGASAAEATDAVPGGGSPSSDEDVASEATAEPASAEGQAGGGEASESGGDAALGDGPPPTWTPAADAAASPEDRAGGTVAGGGPNWIPLLLGLIVLVGAGIWFRRRM